MATRSRILGLRRALNAVRGCSFSSVSRNPTQRVSPLLASRHNNASSLPSCRRWAEHSQVRFRSWTELRDCKHWLITLSFPNPKPSRDEMIDAYVKTLASVLGSEEEAKKKIYALSTTVYTGFQCNIDEATSEKLKDQPLVDWVLPDGYGDPELGIFGGDRYNNGVITPDPNPPKPYSERRGPPRNYGTPRSPIERHGDFRARDGPVQGDRPGGDFVRSVPPTERQGGFRPADGRGYNQDVGSRTHMDGRPPMQNEPARSFDWKDSMQGTREPFQG